MRWRSSYFLVRFPLFDFLGMKHSASQRGGRPMSGRMRTGQVAAGPSREAAYGLALSQEVKITDRPVTQQVLLIVGGDSYVWAALDFRASKPRTSRITLSMTTLSVVYLMQADRRLILNFTKCVCRTNNNKKQNTCILDRGMSTTTRDPTTGGSACSGCLLEALQARRKYTVVVILRGVV